MTSRKKKPRYSIRSKTNLLFNRDWFLQRVGVSCVDPARGELEAFGLNKGRLMSNGLFVRGLLFNGLLLSGLLLSGLLLSGLLLSGCRDKEMPKPYAYARLEYPSSDYRTFHLPGHPCRFDYPGFFTVAEKPSGKPGTRWVDLRWPAYGATLFTTYRHLPSPASAEEMAEEMQLLLSEKLPEHTPVNTRLVTLQDSNLKAYVFEIDGPTSIPFEFLISDDRQNLFQGIVQFDQSLNRDSLEDILRGLSVDINHLITSFSFTSTP